MLPKYILPNIFIILYSFFGLLVVFTEFPALLVLGLRVAKRLL